MIEKESPHTFCACSRLMWIVGKLAWQSSKEHPEAAADTAALPVAVSATADTAALAVALSSIAGQAVGPVCTRNQSTMGGDLREGIMSWGCSKAISNSFTPLLCTVMRNRILKIHSWKKLCTILILLCQDLQSYVICFGVINIMVPGRVCYHSADMNSDPWLQLLTFHAEDNDDHQKDDAH